MVSARKQEWLFDLLGEGLLERRLAFEFPSFTAVPEPYYPVSKKG
jgi:hypothetical protein